MKANHEKQDAYKAVLSPNLILTVILISVRIEMPELTSQFHLIILFPTHMLTHRVTHISL